MGHIDISIIVPVFNSEKYLTRCLNSIRQQSGFSYEVIIVNDCSPGDCDSIVRTYSDVFENLVYLKHEVNRGLMQARLTGIRAAKGEYLLHVDSDDWVGPLTLKHVLSLAEAERADVVHFATYESFNGKSTPHFQNRSASYVGASIADAFADGELWWTQWGKLFKTDVVKRAYSRFRVFDFEEHVNSLEDLALMLPVILSVEKYVCVSDIGAYYYYSNPSSMTKNLTSDVGRWNKLCDDMRKVKDLSLDYLGHFKNQEDIKHKFLKLFHRVNFQWAYGLLHEMETSHKKTFLNKLIESFEIQYCLSYISSQDIYLLDIKINTKKKFFDRSKPIVFISQHLQGGGAERATALLCNELVNRGYVIAVVTDKGFDKGADYYLDKRVARYEVPPSGEERYISLTSLVDKIEATIVVHTSHYRVEMMLDILSLSNGCFNIGVEHSMFFFPFYGGDIRLFLQRSLAYKYLDALVCLSDFNKNIWTASGVGPVKVIRNLATFSSTHNNLNRAADRNILFVGRLCEMKGIYQALEVMRLVLRKCPDAKLLVLGHYGAKADESMVRSYIDRCKLGSAVEILGRQADVSPFYTKSRVHIMTSLLEGEPMVLNEAKMHGVPSVLLGLKYLDGIARENGVVSVDKEDFQGMADEIVRVLTDDGYFVELSQNAVASLDRSLKSDVVSSWESLFQNIGNFSMDVKKDDTLHIVMTEMLDGLRYSLVKGNHLRQKSASRNDTFYVDKLLPHGSMRRRVGKYIYISLKAVKRTFYKVNVFN